MSLDDSEPTPDSRRQPARLSAADLEPIRNAILDLKQGGLERSFHWFVTFLSIAIAAVSIRVARDANVLSEDARTQADRWETAKLDHDTQRERYDAMRQFVMLMMTVRGEFSNQAVLDAKRVAQMRVVAALMPKESRNTIYAAYLLCKIRHDNGTFSSMEVMSDHATEVFDTADLSGIRSELANLDCFSESEKNIAGGTEENDTKRLASLVFEKGKWNATRMDLAETLIRRARITSSLESED